MVKCDCSGWATKNDLLCADGRIIRKDAFKHNDGETVPLVYNHNHVDPENILGHALLENRDDGVYAYCSFNDSKNAKIVKEAVRHGDVRSLSIFANKLKQSGNDVLHGFIKEVSIVLAGANPGAFIDSVMIHGEDTEEGLVICYDENIMAHHYADDEDSLEHAETAKKEDDKALTDEKKVEEKEEKAEPKTEDKEEKKSEDKTVGDVIESMTEEQKTVMYALIAEAVDSAENETEDDDKVEHSEGGTNTMSHNIFESGADVQTDVLSHADQMEIINLARSSSVGSLKTAMQIYAEENSLAHGIDDIAALFPDYKNIQPGAPELLERDQSWVSYVMNKAHKSPVSRIRTRQADARAAEVRAKGYDRTKGDPAGKKTLSANIKLITRTTDPQTVYFRDELHRDDIIDIDFDVVAYQKNVMRHNLEEAIALAALVGDGREDTDPDKISETHIRSVWHDDDVYTIKAVVDVAAAKTALQGTNTGANFGDNYVYAEAFLESALHAREQYRGKGTLDLYCTPHLLNVMLLARDLNGRRIYDSASDLAKALNVGSIHTVEQMEGLTRTTDDDKTMKLLGIFVNMANYTFGSTKGGEITSFEDFDLDFNKMKYLMEARVSGALTEVASAIAIEEEVTAAAG